MLSVTLALCVSTSLWAIWVESADALKKKKNMGVNGVISSRE